MNIATAYLNQQNETVADYDGNCGSLVDELILNDPHPDDRVLYVDGFGLFDHGWVYHMVLLRAGLVHDAWCEGDPLTPREWLIRMFRPDGEVEVAIDGDDVFAGRCADFPVDVDNL